MLSNYFNSTLFS